MMQIEGYGVVCENDCIADADGTMPEALKSDAEWAFFQAGLDASDVIVLGRKSHEVTPNPKGRRRLVITNSVELSRWEGQRTVLWNPAGAPIETALDMFDIEVTRLGVTGGRLVFDYFLQSKAGYTAFHLSRMRDVYLHGGVKVFSALEDVTRTAESVLKDYQYLPTGWKQLDEVASVVTSYFLKSDLAFDKSLIRELSKMGIMGVLFNPNGRIQANQFWQGLIILAGLGVILPIVTVYGPIGLGGIASIVSILLLYPFICVFGKRLHDSGKTAWMSLLFFLAYFAIFTVGTMIAFPMVDGYTELQAEMQEELAANGFNLQVISEYGRKVSELTFIPNMILSLIVTLAIGFLCARFFSDPYTNKYGPPVGGEAEGMSDDNDIFS